MGIPDFANEPIVRPAATSAATQLEDMITVIPSPAAAFEHRRDGRFGLAMLASTILGTAIFFFSKPVILPYIEADIVRSMHAAMAKNPQMTEKMLQTAVDRAESFGWIAPLVVFPIVLLVLGLTLWLVGKLVGSRQTAGQAIAVAVIANVPRILQAIVNWAQGLFLNNADATGMAQLSLSPARFMDPTTVGPAAIAFATRFDLVTIWVTVLLGIGLSVTGAVTRKQGLMGALIVWLLATAVTVLPALARG